MPPKVSVIMNCRNGEKYLREAIDSVYAQSFKDWEIIFWDNLSTDKSPEIAKSYGERLRYFRGTEPLPLGAARNMAIEKATGDFIAFLDVDDVWKPEHLKSRLDAFDAETVLVYGNLIVRDMTAGKDYIPFNPAREFYSGDVSSHLCRKSFIWLQSLLVRTSAVRKLGQAFDPILLTAEDLDFLLRLSLTGKFNYVSEPTVYYRVHESNITMSKRHYFAHDFSYLLDKYKAGLPKPMLKDLARQYIQNVRIDMISAGFRVLPFLRLGASPRQILMTAAYTLFPGKQTLEIKNILKKPLDVLSSFFNLFRNLFRPGKGR